MKEQDAAHSDEQKFNLLNRSLSALYTEVDQIVAEDVSNNILPYVIELRSELTRLRSELQQKDDAINKLLVIAGYGLHELRKDESKNHVSEEWVSIINKSKQLIKKP